jgi:hypothetical protein
MATSTIWGKSQTSRKIVRGITFYATASHGGFKLSKTKNDQVPDYMKKSTHCQDGVNGWYEEDCDWSIVVLFFPELFPEKTYKTALEVIKRFHANAWEQYKRENS